MRAEKGGGRRVKEDTYRLALFSFPPRWSFHSEVASAPLGHRTQVSPGGGPRGRALLAPPSPPVSQDLQWVFRGHRRVCPGKPMPGSRGQ